VGAKDADWHDMPDLKLRGLQDPRTVATLEPVFTKHAFTLSQGYVSSRRRLSRILSPRKQIAPQLEACRWRERDSDDPRTGQHSDGSRNELALNAYALGEGR
jgi:hypothetical protein